MVDPHLWKSWKITKIHLRHAYQNLTQPSENNADEYQRLVKTYREFVERNELELALDTLEELGHLSEYQGSFWRNLERAATTMELTDKASKLHNKFLETLRKMT